MWNVFFNRLHKKNTFSSDLSGLTTSSRMEKQIKKRKIWIPIVCSIYVLWSSSQNHDVCCFDSITSVTDMSFDRTIHNWYLYKGSLLNILTEKKLKGKEKTENERSNKRVGKREKLKKDEKKNRKKKGRIKKERKTGSRK